MNKSIGRKMGLGFGTLLVLMLTLAVVVLVNLEGMHRRFAYVIEHDAPVIANARHLLTLVVDMETGQRGFVITGKEEFLEPYENARIDFVDLISAEKLLVSDNLSQVKRLEKIEASLRQWNTKAAQPEIAMRRKISEATVDAHHLQEIISQGVGKRLMDRFMTLGHEIEVAFSDRQDWEGAFTVEVIEKIMADREDGQRGFLITGKEEFLDKYDTGEQTRLPDYFAKLRMIVADRELGDEFLAKVDQLQQLAEEWTRKAAEPEIAARRTMNDNPETLRDVAAMLEIGTGKRILDSIREDFRLFIEAEESLTAMRFAAASRAANTTTFTTIVLALVSLVFGAVVALWITLGITKPVRNLADAVGRVAKGDLCQEIGIESDDEIGALSKSFNRMVCDLKQLEEGREQSKQALQGAKEYTDNIIRSMIDMLVVVARDGSIATVNEATCDQLGFSADELVGQPASFLFSATIAEAAEEEADRLTLFQEILPLRQSISRRLNQDGSFKHGEATFVSRSGDEIPVALSGAVMSDSAGKTLQIVCVARDIRERKKAEQELKKTMDQLAIAKQNADAANASKSEFLANMSHEIRTPMTAILGFNDLLLDNLNKPENIEAAHTVQANGEYLISLINDILDLSKIEAGKLDVEQISCSPHEIVAEVASLMRVRATAKGLPLDLHFDGPIPRTIQSDPTRLRQILINIVGNAIKFTETGSVQIIIRLMNESGEDAQMRFDVVDTGIGLAEDGIEKLFQPFTQADSSTTRQHGGTGLGLTICNRLVELLGGEISVVSTPGEGSTFSITVATGPLADVPMFENATEAIGETKVANASSASKSPLLGRHILLAEDGPDNQRLISFVLKKAGAEVTLADNGQIALDLATAAMEEGCPFDVILMDMQMPVLDGYAATRRLRENGYPRPILALTAHAMSTDRQRCLDAGCDDYATKPIDRKRLLSLIARYAASSSEATHAIG